MPEYDVIAAALDEARTRMKWLKNEAAEKADLDADINEANENIKLHKEAIAIMTLELVKEGEIHQGVETTLGVYKAVPVVSVSYQLKFF